MVPVNIEGFSFLLDVAYRRIITPDMKYWINIDAMLDKGTHYEFPIDSLNGQLLSPWNRKNRQIWATMPPMVQVDPKGIRKHYAIAHQDHLPILDADLKCNQELFRRRIETGKLPTFFIEKTEFILDVRCEQVRKVLQPEDPITSWQIIEFKDFIRHPIEIEFFYDRKSAKIVPLPFAFNYHKYVPKGTERYSLPGIKLIDPVACARKERRPDNYYIDKYPIQTRINARINPVEPERRRLPQRYAALPRRRQSSTGKGQRL